MNSEILRAHVRHCSAENSSSSSNSGACSFTVSTTEECRVEQRGSEPLSICEKTIRRFRTCAGREREQVSCQHIIEEVNLSERDRERTGLQQPGNIHTDTNHRGAENSSSPIQPGVGQCLEELLRHADELSQQHGMAGDSQVEQLNRGQISRGWQRSYPQENTSYLRRLFSGILFRHTVQAQGINHPDNKTWEEFKKDFQEV